MSSWVCSNKQCGTVEFGITLTHGIRCPECGQPRHYLIHVYSQDPDSSETRNEVAEVVAEGAAVRVVQEPTTPAHVPLTQRIWAFLITLLLFPTIVSHLNRYYEETEAEQTPMRPRYDWKVLAVSWAIRVLLWGGIIGMGYYLLVRL